ncbi:transcriptional regulator [Aureimonas sp. Leaf454]|uniref:helix-turn-helix transcriptional regulator n=1 Tax=Aureimonas sp. Leaf454 TaxID=1736381 RepID=UPI000700DBF6|nr:AraC family transcriptional regulator [Aureimonas sp. Leaf454]KQT44562.1 transcriptional regulator [Aureimonas sp. Leaf454]
MTSRSQADEATAGLHGARLGHHLKMASQEILRVEAGDRLSLAVTRLTCGSQDRDMTAPLVPEPAFSVTYKLAPVDLHEFWSDGRHRHSRGFGAGTVKAVDLCEDPRSRVHGAFDGLQFYFRKDRLDEIADERGARRIEALRPSLDEPDPILGKLCEMLLAAPPGLAETNRFFVDQISLGFLTYFAESYGGMRAPAKVGSTLAPWQERRAREILQSRLAARITMADVASECGLTPSYFARAFRQTVGMSPHRFLTDLRLQEAKCYLLGSTLSLADIALLCGFGDQSYFTRVFTSTVGSSPGAWRRRMRS